jgi:hypothetical protein
MGEILKAKATQAKGIAADFLIGKKFAGEQKIVSRTGIWWSVCQSVNFRFSVVKASARISNVFDVK